MRGALFTAQELPVAAIRNADAAGPVVLVCEHASAAIPAALKDLQLTPEARFSHIAWDPGALAVAERLADALSAPLVHACVSRLVYDCNRPPEASDAIPEVSEVFQVPGNRALTDADKARRVNEIYEPFHALVAETLDKVRDPVLVTVHSFTRLYRGQERAVELGLLHDSDARMADAMLGLAKDQGALARWRVERNAPYGPQDGVTHTLRHHALPRGIANVMIEIRNDLIEDDAAQDGIAAHLAEAIRQASAQLQPEPAVEGS